MYFRKRAPLSFDLAVQAAQTTRNWTVAGIAGYRCELLCKASREKHLFNTARRVHLVWLLVAGGLLLVSLPRGFEFRFVLEELGCPGDPESALPNLPSGALAATDSLSAGTNGHYWEIVRKPLLLAYNLQYVILYRGLLLFLVQSGGPVITVLVCSFDRFILINDIQFIF